MVKRIVKHWRLAWIVMKDLVGTGIRCGNLFDFPSAVYGWNDSGFHKSPSGSPRLHLLEQPTVTVRITERGE